MSDPARRWLAVCLWKTSVAPSPGFGVRAQQAQPCVALSAGRVIRRSSARLRWIPFPELLSRHAPLDRPPFDVNWHVTKPDGGVIMIMRSRREVAWESGIPLPSEAARNRDDKSGNRSLAFVKPPHVRNIS